jgi:hypothetical protein
MSSESSGGDRLNATTSATMAAPRTRLEIAGAVTSSTA